MDPSVSTGENPDSNENNPQESESESESNNSRSDALGKALSTMLANVIKDLDSKAQDTLNSQDKLNSAIDRLTRELDQLLEDAPLPFIMQHAAKISGVRKRVSSLNSVLKSIQKRVDNIDRLLSAGMEDNSGQPIATLVLVLKAQARRRTLKVVLALLWATRSYGEVAAMTHNAMLLVYKKDRQKVLMGFA